MVLRTTEDHLSAWQVILWWEKRRIPYNILIGTVGIISLILFMIFITNANVVKPGEDAVEPMAIFIAPILINICYTSGWIIELVLRTVFKSPKLGTVLLKIGISFSLLMVLLPSLGGFIALLIHGNR